MFLHRYDNDYKLFTCTQPSSNGQFCGNYTTVDDSLDEAEFGHSSCEQVSANGEYCQQWEHVQAEYKKCWLGVIITNDGPIQTEICCNKENRLLYPCCNTACDKTNYNARPPQVEYLSCACQTPSSNEKYCQLWTCEQYSWPGQTYAQGREYETYTCVEADSTDSYCKRWKGNIESIEEFEVDKCYCTKVSTNGQFCQDWTCEEIGVDMWYPNLYWNFFAVILGGLGNAVVLVVLMNGAWRRIKEDFLVWRKYFLMYLCICFIWGGGFLMIGVWKAGVGVLLISGGILLFPVLFVFLYALWLNSKEVNQYGQVTPPARSWLLDGVVMAARRCGDCVNGNCLLCCPHQAEPVPVVIVNDDLQPRRNDEEVGCSRSVRKVEMQCARVEELTFSG